MRFACVSLVLSLVILVNSARQHHKERLLTSTCGFLHLVREFLKGIRDSVVNIIDGLRNGDVHVHHAIETAINRAVQAIIRFRGFIVSCIESTLVFTVNVVFHLLDGLFSIIEFIPNKLLTCKNPPVKDCNH